MTEFISQLQQAFQTGEFLLTGKQLLYLFAVIGLLLYFTRWIFWTVVNASNRYIILPIRKRLERYATNQQEKERLERRRQFADYIESEIRRLNNLESWSHNRFTELEAEVEAEGNYRIRNSLFRKRSGLRRVDSLTEALETSEERLILLQGEPGSGKSVALRQVALTMARKAMRDPGKNSKIPLYINMKHLVRHGTISSSTNQELQANVHFDQSGFHRLLKTHFNIDEIQDICFQLNVNIENLPGNTLAQKTRELILRTERHGLTPDLIKIAASLRPKVHDFQKLAEEFSQDRLENPFPSINQYLIRDFILDALNRANDRDIEAFLEKEFDRGLRERTWVFFLDSFDEIPDVLSSTEADQTIQAYGDAIADFLGGLNKCRGIVASRSYRGPTRLGWPRFRILPLKSERQQELIRKTGLNNDLAGRVIGHLDTAEHSMRAMASNPLFLGLICEFMQKQSQFPANTYIVYEGYIQERLTRDRERLWRRFQLKPESIRYTAEQVAFSMTADAGLGLSPTRDELISSCLKLELDIPENLESSLDALEFLKLARSETTIVGESKPFTFAHRRFQEYFATSVVLREPTRVQPNDLLTDGRWRETAVVLCQTQPKENLQPIISEAENLINEMAKQTSALLPENTPVPDENTIAGSQIAKMPFPWQQGSLHLLSVLQDGFSGHLHDLPNILRMNIGQILWSATRFGMHYDTKWAVEVAGTLPQGLLTEMLDLGFNSTLLIQDISFRQAVRLNRMTEDIADAIYKKLRKMLWDGSIIQERYSTQSHLARLDQSENFLATYKFLADIPNIALAIQLLSLVTLASFIIQTANFYISLPIVGLSILLIMTFSLTGWVFYRSSKIGFRKLISTQINVFFLTGAILFSSLAVIFILFAIATPSNESFPTPNTSTQTIDDESFSNQTLAPPIPNNSEQGKEDLSSDFYNSISIIISAFWYSTVIFISFGFLIFFVTEPMMIYARNGLSFERATRAIRQNLKSQLSLFRRSMLKIIELTTDWIRKAFSSPMMALRDLMRGLFNIFELFALILIVFLPILLLFFALLQNIWIVYFFVCFLVILFWPLFLSVGYSLRERGKIRRLTRTQTTSLTGDLFLSTIGRFRFSQTRLDFFKLVRMRGLLEYNHQTENFLQQLSQAIFLAKQHQSYIDKIIGSTKTKPEPPFRKMLRQLKNEPNKLNRFTKYNRIVLEIRLNLAVSLNALRTSPTIIEFAPPIYKRTFEYLFHRLYAIKGSENILPHPYQPLKLSFTETDIFTQWYIEYTKPDQYRLANWHQNDLLDEICLMLEQCRISQG